MDDEMDLGDEAEEDEAEELGDSDAYAAEGGRTGKLSVSFRTSFPRMDIDLGMLHVHARPCTCTCSCCMCRRTYRFHRLDSLQPTG